MLNALVLMAGSDALFHEAGYPYPKNLVEIDGLPVAERVIAGLAPLREAGARFIFALRRDEDRLYHTAAVVKLLVPDAVVVSVPTLTGGAACTALLAVDQILNDDPLVILNGDQILDVDLASVTQGFREAGLDGGIVVFRAVHPRWSYVRCGADGLVVEAAEKRPISDLATAGVYYFARGRDFVVAAMESIKKDAPVEGLFYVCPCYNEMILQQARIGIHQIPRDAYHSLATPQSVASYADVLLRRRERS